MRFIGFAFTCAVLNFIGTTHAVPPTSPRDYKFSTTRVVVPGPEAEYFLQDTKRVGFNQSHISVYGGDRYRLFQNPGGEWEETASDKTSAVLLSESPGSGSFYEAVKNEFGATSVLKDGQEMIPDVGFDIDEMHFAHGNCLYMKSPQILDQRGMCRTNAQTANCATFNPGVFLQEILPSQAENLLAGRSYLRAIYYNIPKCTGLLEGLDIIKIISIEITVRFNITDVTGSGVDVSIPLQFVPASQCCLVSIAFVLTTSSRFFMNIDNIPVHVDVPDKVYNIYKKCGDGELIRVNHELQKSVVRAWRGKYIVYSDNEFLKACTSAAMCRPGTAPNKNILDIRNTSLFLPLGGFSLSLPPSRRCWLHIRGASVAEDGTFIYSYVDRFGNTTVCASKIDNANGLQPVPIFSRREEEIDWDGCLIVDTEKFSYAEVSKEGNIVLIGLKNKGVLLLYRMKDKSGFFVHYTFPIKQNAPETTFLGTLFAADRSESAENEIHFPTANTTSLVFSEIEDTWSFRGAVFGPVDSNDPNSPYELIYFTFTDNSMYSSGTVWGVGLVVFLLLFAGAILYISCYRNKHSAKNTHKYADLNRTHSRKWYQNNHVDVATSDVFAENKKDTLSQNTFMMKHATPQTC